MKNVSRIFLGLLMCCLITASMGADYRTKPIRLVPVTNAEITPQPVSVSVTSTVEGEKIPELMASLKDYIIQGFEKLEYPVKDDAPLKFELIAEYIDFGSQGKRLLTGGLIGGKGHIEGTVVLTKNGKEIGRFKFSSRIRGGLTQGSIKAMGKEIGPPLVLKLHNGERDDSLHERPVNKKKE